MRGGGNELERKNDGREGGGDGCSGTEKMIENEREERKTTNQGGRDGERKTVR